MPGLPLHSVRDVWENTVGKFPRKTAIIFEGEERSFREIDELSAALAGHLQQRLGVKKGDRVAIAMPNCLEFYLTYWATIRLGAVVAPVNIRLGTPEMNYVIQNVGAEVLFLHAETREAVMPALAGAENLRHIVSVGYAEEETVPFEVLLRPGRTFDRPGITEEDLAVICHTSGTTGQPKGAMMRHGDLLFNIKNTLLPLSLRHEDVNLLLVPLFHATGLYSLVPTSAYLGSTVVMAPRSDPREVVELIARHRVTTFLSVPTFHYLVTHLRDLDRYDLSCLRVIGYSGSPMPPQTIARLRQRFPQASLHNFFGLTETISITHVTSNEDADIRPHTIGKLLPDVGAKVVDDEGRELGPNEVGRLLIHRENVIRGYWNQPGRLEESLTPDGEWFDTGDLALVDEDGYYFLQGRQKEMIIVAGENVFALEVERCILECPGVREVAVVGVEATGVRAYLGELIKAVVVPAEGAELTELDIKRHCNERLASYKVPHLVEFREALPRNPSGKVLKRDLV